MAQLDELIAASQAADLALEENRRTKERAANEANRAKQRAASQISLKTLLEKMWGAGEAAPLNLQPPTAVKPQEKHYGESAFPPPPTST